MRDVGAILDQPVQPFEVDSIVGERRACHASIRHVDARHIARRLSPSRQARFRAPGLPTANRQKSEFLAVFSHELRGSLGVIRNAAQLLGLQHGETCAGKKSRQLIERQVARMTRLADDLIDVARISSGGYRLQCERIDLRDVVKHAIETVEWDIAARNHRLATSLPELPVWLHADAGRLEQVLVNLLVNAAKYTDQGGDLSLSIHHKDDQAILRIRDSGIGIAADVLPRVFDLFMQADPLSRRTAAGLGIGLALVRSLVALHGGSVTATSAGLGQGSEFIVRLPAL